MVGDKNQGVGKGWYRQSNHVRLGAISPNSDEEAHQTFWLVQSGTGVRLRVLTSVKTELKSLSETK